MVNTRDGRLLRCAALLAMWMSAAAGAAHPYVDPAQLDLDWPRYSFARQPWRSYLEVMPATAYLQGLGVVWGPPVPGRSEDQVASELASAGFRRVRIELPWSLLRWDEQGMVPAHAERTLRRLQALRRHGLRPLVLLNANDAAPCPMRITTWRTAATVPAGSRQLPLAGAIGTVPAGFTMVAGMATPDRPAPLVTGLSADGRALLLSLPLPRALAAGEPVQLAELKYAPLDEVGTAQFERTAGGWIRYVEYITRLVTEVYGPDFDMEIWNELGFGSAFLDIARYGVARDAGPRVDALHAGGRAWELAHRTVQSVAQLAPRVRVIWGFSSTSFFHTPVDALPPGIAGQSYHPYGVGPRCHARLIVGRESLNADGFVPAGCATQPEGWAQSFQQTETLMRLLNPRARVQRPPQTAHFAHYITEHGFSARELGLADAAAVERARAKFLLRAPVFWLNKGVTGLYVYGAHDADALGFGVLGADGRAGAALQALRRMTDLFAPAREVVRARPLDVQVMPVGRVPAPYRNDPEGRVVAPEDLVALLPFDTGTGRLLIVAYVMSEDFPRDLPPQRFRIELGSVAADGATLRLHDPLAGTVEAVRAVAQSQRSITLELALTDAPRVLEIIDP